MDRATEAIWRDFLARYATPALIVVATGLLTLVANGILTQLERMRDVMASQAIRITAIETNRDALVGVYSRNFEQLFKQVESIGEHLDDLSNQMSSVQARMEIVIDSMNGGQPPRPPY